MDNNLLPEVEKKIITLRNQQVILANHVADLYGVETREVNQAVKNNPEKFPEGYIFELNKQEKEELTNKVDKTILFMLHNHKYKNSNSSLSLSNTYTSTMTFFTSPYILFNLDTSPSL